MGCCEDGTCKCGHNHEHEHNHDHHEHHHEITIEDIVQNNNIVLNTLIDLLIQKGLISEKELRDKLAEVAKDLESQEQKEEEIEEEIEEELDNLEESDEESED